MTFLTEDNRVFELDFQEKTVYLRDEYEQKHDLAEQLEIEDLKELGDFVESLREENIIPEKTADKMMDSIISSWNP